MIFDLNGKIELNKTGLRIVFDEDFIRYYRWLINKYYFNTLQLSLPRHGAHISIITQKLHGDKFERGYDYLKQYNNQNVTVKYDNYINIGGKTFDIFWMKVQFPLGDKIKNDLGIVEQGFLGYHISICSNKHIIQTNI